MTAETWRPVVGWPDYEVSDHGRVRSYIPFHHKPLPRVVALGADPKGYPVARLWGGRLNRVHRRVHRLVLEAFVGPRPRGLVTRHLNGIPTDNRLSNLRYGTYAENMADRLLHEEQRKAAAA